MTYIAIFNLVVVLLAVLGGWLGPLDRRLHFLGGIGRAIGGAAKGIGKGIGKAAKGVAKVVDPFVPDEFIRGDWKGGLKDLAQGGLLAGGIMAAPAAIGALPSLGGAASSIGSAAAGGFGKLAGIGSAIGRGAKAVGGWAERNPELALGIAGGAADVYGASQAGRAAENEAQWQRGRAEMYDPYRRQLLERIVSGRGGPSYGSVGK